MSPAARWQRALRVAAVVCVAAAAAAVVACRAPRPERPINTACGAEGFLRVRNFTGRVLEVYEAAGGQTQFIGFASPGVTQIPVRGPSSDLSVAYRVREPSEGRDAATVTWLRPDAVGRGQSRLVLELRCR